MCGIVGIAGAKLLKRDVDIFKQLLQVSILRGEDSTGIFGVTEPSAKTLKKITNGKVSSLATTWRKRAEPSGAFLRDRGIEQYLSGSYRALVGHTRAATQGAVTDENAHPFDFDNVIGVHNGTTGKYQIAGGSEFETDSEAIYNLIDEFGVDAALEDLLGFDYNPMALVFFDRNNNTLNFIRNKSKTNESRPLAIARTKDKKRIVWASEAWAVLHISKRNGFELDDEHKYAEPRIAELWSYSLLDDKFPEKPMIRMIQPRKKVVALPKPTPSRMESRNAPYVGGDQASREAANRNDPPFRRPEYEYGVAPIVQWTDYIDEKVFERLTNVASDDDDRSALDEWLVQRALPRRKKVREYPPKRLEIENQTFHGPLGKVLDYHGFKSYLDKGCCNCEHVPDITEKGIEFKIGWIDSDTGWLIACETCKEVPVIRDNYIAYDPSDLNKRNPQ